ncbi:MAG: thiamine pyrophosphate-dependent enzyme [Pseudomonas sp.]
MMNMVQACGVVAKQRPQDSIVVSTMGAMFIFDRIEGEDGQANMVPMVGGTAGLVTGLAAAKVVSAVSCKLPSGEPKKKASRISSAPLMGGAAGLGLGLAMAQPQRKVIVLDGDSSLLMELSGLVTVASQKPVNLLHVVIHNGTQFTGLANLETVTTDFKFAEAARNAGYAHAEMISDGETWAKRFPSLMAMPGPVFVELLVDPVPSRTKEGYVAEQMPDLQFERMGVEAAALQAALAEGVST